MSDDDLQRDAHGPFGGNPHPARRRSSLPAAVPWLVGSVIVLGLALVGGLATAYLVATFRQVPPPAAVMTPTPSPQPTASPSPQTSELPSASPPPASSPTAAASATPEATPLVHIVQSGESISLIAVEYGTTVEAIVELNELRNPNLIVPGQRLLIPPPSEEP